MIRGSHTARTNTSALRALAVRTKVATYAPSAFALTTAASSTCLVKVLHKPVFDIRGATCTARYYSASAESSSASSSEPISANATSAENSPKVELEVETGRTNDDSVNSVDSTGTDTPSVQSASESNDATTTSEETHTPNGELEVETGRTKVDGVNSADRTGTSSVQPAPHSALGSNNLTAASAEETPKVEPEAESTSTVNDNVGAAPSSDADTASFSTASEPTADSGDAIAINANTNTSAVEPEAQPKAELDSSSSAKERMNKLLCDSVSAPSSVHHDVPAVQPASGVPLDEASADTMTSKLRRTFDLETITLWPPWQVSDLHDYERWAYAKHGPHYFRHLNNKHKTQALFGMANRRMLEAHWLSAFGDDWYSYHRAAAERIKEPTDRWEVDWNKRRSAVVAEIDRCAEERLRVPEHDLDQEAKSARGRKRKAAGLEHRKLIAERAKWNASQKKRYLGRERWDVAAQMFEERTGKTVRPFSVTIRDSGKLPAK